MIRVLHDRVLVALPPKEHEQDAATGYTFQAGPTTASGLLLAKPADAFNIEIATRGIVVAVGEKSNTVDLDEVRAAVNDFFLAEAAVNADTMYGPSDMKEIAADVDRLLMGMQPAPFDVEPGDLVLFPPSAGDEITEGGLSYVILHESEIIGVVDDPKES
jgi:co-chaperonin GroES (HSP10)